MTSSEVHRGISALTLSTRDMARAVAFYQTLGFRLDYGGPEASFSTLWAGPTALNLTTETGHAPPGFWGRAIFEVADVPWMERYFHLKDPDGHELSFMTPIGAKA